MNPSGLPWRSRTAFGALAALAAISSTTPLAAEPVSCLSPDPSHWPAPAKPYILIVADTSGSMSNNVAQANDCLYQNNRNGHLRCALKHTFETFGGQAQFGLATFARTMTSCPPGPCLQDFGGCAFQDAPNNATALGCGPEPNPAAPFSASRAGANIVVPIVPETTPPPPSNLPTLLNWVDNSCIGGQELFANGSSPLNGVLRDAFRYFSNKWESPFFLNTFLSPLTSVANGERPCRSVSVVFITDGNDTCDAPADVFDAAADLFSGFSKDGLTWHVKTFVVNFIDSYKADADTIAAAGGTFPSYLASDAAGLSLTLSSIITSNIYPEICDNVDNDCNGCTDEGFPHYCDVGQACCPWATAQDRTSCLALYKSSITPGLPNGDVTKLPCTTAAQQVNPATWLCYNPKETCDGFDNNCSNGVDEGTTKCGNPAHCPQAEICNGVDDNCDGSIDEGGLCAACVPSPEICDGCDNDCNGLTDDGILPIPCGLASPAWCMGQITCKAPQVVPKGGCVLDGGFNLCNNAPSAEVCNNGIDDNCNGQIDDGASSACDPPGGPYNYGPNSHCKKGIRPCNSDNCQGAVGPEVEICDGIDNDCDGQVDEGALNLGQTCGLNQPPCSPGTTACVGGALVCQGGAGPQPEVCDGIDNNCNGQIDDKPLADAPAPGLAGCWNLPGNICAFHALTWSPPAGATCNGLGTLSSACLQGTLTCQGALGWACVGPEPPSAEVCDGIDNDCNYLVDDGDIPFLGIPCGSDQGECVPGTLACVNGVIDCIGDTEPAPEICDGKDNDCDGQIDNDLPTFGPCTQPFDEAAYSNTPTDVMLIQLPCLPGHFECNAGALNCVGGVGPSPEVCDGIDNDCDGSIDEAGVSPNGLDGTSNPFPPPNAVIGDPCGIDIGVCKQGAYSCVNGSFVCLGGQGPEAEVCDGVDNNCDGEIDENAACIKGKQCVQAASGYQCAAPCPAELPCPLEQHCERVLANGVPSLYCVAGAPDTSGASSSGSVSTGNGGGGGAGMNSSHEAPWGLATGGGGCSCEAPSSGAGASKTGAILSLLIASSILRRRRAGPAASRSESRIIGRFDRALQAMAALLLALTLSVLVSGCSTEAFCFGDCASNRGSGAGGQDSTMSAGGASQSGGGAACLPTNGGVDVCDGQDNDCDGIIDRGPGINFEAASSCGTCDNDCSKLLTNCIVDAMHCLPSAHPGDEPGTCTCGKCEDGYYDIDQNGSCEYFCIMNSSPESECNGRDDNCNGKIDEDVDLCTSTESCGACGVACVTPHGVPKCVHDGAVVCDASNTHCAIESCACNGLGDCWWDLDGATDTGCEYQCDPTNGGVEICGDGIDNDCDGKIDSADDLSGDPLVGKPCFGDPDGECATAAHAGTYVCSGNQVVCAGANVLHQDDVPETCNNKDDDCDGVVDDNAAHVGEACGQSNLAPCKFGKLGCLPPGSLVCVGAVNPVAEVCDGLDNDCDGSIDFTVGSGSEPADSVGACNVPPAPPAGATSPCKPGMKACVGGVVLCQGSTGPSGPSDGCSVDANCDGTLTNQPDLANDVTNCGACGNNCLAGAVHAVWSCQSGACVYAGCESGYYDLNNDQKCEYACQSTGPEQCNGIDDDCDGPIDEGILGVPTPTQVCGVSPAATSPECTAGVGVVCQNGAWKCLFPAGVCSPSCGAAIEICDGLDNNCNGAINENVPAYGSACASDDASPVPGDGPCRTLGTIVCNGPNAVKCSATKANCSSLPGGCTELCDGIDNDCDGVTDEPFSAKGSNASFFVKPAVTKIGAAPATWIYTYEASRQGATATKPGLGNGYHTSAPPGVALEKTVACSNPNKKPWYKVAGPEVEQTCEAQGGFICPTSTWTAACQASTACSWGYSPRGSACMSSFTQSKLCNLGPSFDFDPTFITGDQDGLLPTASPLLSSCWADWSNLEGNNAPFDRIFDITGNLREITSAGGGFYSLMGGSFMTGIENGAKCDNTNYLVDASFQYLDTGFRCCFLADPTL